MKRTKHFYLQTHTRRQQSFFRAATGYNVVVMYLICAQWIFAAGHDSVDAAAVVAGAAVEDKVTLPSRNEATNPLKEPTPSTLQGAFLGGNLTDATNGSTSTTPAAIASTTAAAAAETVWNARTAAVATLPADSPRRNESTATATRPDPGATNRPLESWENVVHTSTTEQPPSSSTTAGDAADYDLSAAVSDLKNKNLMANMLKSWFKHNGDDTAGSADDKAGYYKLAAEYVQRNRGGGGGDGGTVAAATAAAAAAAGVRGDGDRREGTAKVIASKSAKAAVVVAGNKNLFERWDEASEEQERVLEDAMRSEGPDVSSSASASASSSVLAADQNTPSRWFVLLLSGNSTVAQMRRTDFAKYLKLNLAARLSLEYDEVKINRVLVVPPRLMVNVSVVPVSERASAAAAAAAVAAVAASSSSSSSRWPLTAADSKATRDAASHRVIEEDDPLHNLVETNATLMELSGEEYRVERFMSLKSQKPQSMEESASVVSDRHADIDFFIYATVGPLCFVAVLGFLLLTAYKYVRKHPVQWPWKRKFCRQPSFWPGGGGGDCQHRHRRMTDECGGGGGGGFGGAGGGGRGRCGGDSPSADEMAGTVNVIYSGEFEQSQQQQLSGSWLDDASFVPDDSLDRIRTPTLLRTVPAPPPAVKNKTFTDMLQQCGDGDVVGGTDDLLQPRQQLHLHRHHHHHHRSGGGGGGHHQQRQASLDGQCGGGGGGAMTAGVHAQSPRLSRENKLRILGCKQSCLLLPAVQPAAAAAVAAVAVFDNGTATATALAAAATAARPDRLPSPPAEERENDRDQGHP